MQYLKTALKFVRNYSKQNNIIKELVHNVHPFSQIKVASEINLLIQPYDLLDCPNSDKLRTIIDNELNNCRANISIKVNQKVVEVINLCDSNNCKNCVCVLEVPIKSDLCIKSDKNVQISNMYSDKINLIAKGDILLKNIRADLVHLHSSEGGNIICKGLLLAQNASMKAEKDGNIFLDKLQGIHLNCISNNGSITTNSCYVDYSEFITKNGILNLNNVHKTSKIIAEEGGKIKMNGVHGNINIKANITNIDLQLTEIYGENSIYTNGERNLINFSDSVEENCNIEISSEEIILEKSIEHLKECLKNQKYFHSESKINQNKNKLLVITKGLINLGKMSWADNLKLMLEHK